MSVKKTRFNKRDVRVHESKKDTFQQVSVIVTYDVRVYECLGSVPLHNQLT
jgi:hypothetical protein